MLLLMCPHAASHHSIQPQCFSASVVNFTSIFIFATYTQQTIGYGNYFVTSCMSSAIILIIQSVTDILLDAIMLGVLYSRISHPKQRARSIFISDSACIARRDSILKFMFRVGDVQKTQVVDPKVKAYLYTFGRGRRTAEGETIPVRVEALDLPGIAGRLLLPMVVEHTVDEKSPLYGHTHDSLVVRALVSLRQCPRHTQCYSVLFLKFSRFILCCCCVPCCHRSSHPLHPTAAQVTLPLTTHCPLLTTHCHSLHTAHLTAPRRCRLRSWSPLREAPSLATPSWLASPTSPTRCTGVTALSTS